MDGSAGRVTLEDGRTRDELVEWLIEMGAGDSADGGGVRFFV